MNLKHLTNSIENRVYKYINSKKGWRTNRKIIVIESDDWGAIRMPNLKVFNKLLKAGIRVDKCGYCSNDTIASKTDLEALFNTLSSLKNMHGESPKITANTIVANPDFEKIRADHFQKYYYRTIDKTIASYPNSSLEYWKEGIQNNLFKPQLHGREHVNIERWLRALQNGSKEMRLAFDSEMFGISSSISNETNISYLQALFISNENIKSHIDDAAKIFRNLFGFNSDTFIAPNYSWNDFAESILAENCIIGIQGINIQKKLPKNDYHYLGEKNDFNQTYLIRNVIFEPTFQNKSDVVKQTYNQIKKCFENKFPAIICSHRVNYIGGINERNRVENLRKFKELFNLIIKEHPDVEFMYSDELLKII